MMFKPNRSHPRPPAPARRGRFRSLLRDTGAQSLIELAVMVPVFTLLLCYAVEFGYFFIAAASIASAARVGAEYAVQGTISASEATAPTLGSLSTPQSVAGTAYGNLSNYNLASTNVAVQLCTNNNGTITCASAPASSPLILAGYQPDADPEPGLFKLVRVDVVYTISPPIPTSFFPSVLLPSFQFHRSAEMRLMD